MDMTVQVIGNTPGSPPVDRQSEGRLQGRRIAHTLSRPLRVVCVVVTEICIAIISGPLALASYFNFDPKHPDTQRVPILFLHGVNHNQSGSIIGRLLLGLFSKVRKEHLGSIYSINYAGVLTNGRRETFETYADRVFMKVRKVYNQTGQFPHLVGHSMGGIVSTCLVKKCLEAMESGVYTLEDGTTIELNEQERAQLQPKAVVTLGTPFNGSYMADVVCGIQNLLGMEGLAVYRGMMTNNRRREPHNHLNDLQTFAQNASSSGRVRFYNVGSTLDQLVPHGYMVTPERHRQMQVHHLGHLGLLWSPKVWGKVHHWLTRQEATE